MILRENVAGERVSRACDSGLDLPCKHTHDCHVISTESHSWSNAMVRFRIKNAVALRKNFE